MPARTRWGIWLLLAITQGAVADAPQRFGVIRMGVAGSDAPSSWQDGGLGRFLADDDDVRIDAEAQFALLWEPSLEWRLFAQALARTAPGDGRHVGVVEAYLDRNLFLADDQRVRLRAGLSFLPTSREAVDALWQSRYTLTLSALNSWVAEEIRPLGLDASWRSVADAEHEWEWAATLFTGNDSAGALLAWRGFALHDRIGVFGESVPLPALPTLADGAAFGRQRDDGSEPFGRDLDGQPGWSARVRWGEPEHFRLLGTWYDNRGDRDLHRGEYAWRTRFMLLGAEWQVDPRWTVAGEWMRGDSGMGEVAGPHVDLDFDTAYLLASFAPDERWRFSARVERFDIDDRDGTAEDNDDRGHGWTLAAMRRLGEPWRIGVEWLRLDDRHAAADLVGLPRETGGDQWRIELRRVF